MLQHMYVNILDRDVLTHVSIAEPMPLMTQSLSPMQHSVAKPKGQFLVEELAPSCCKEHKHTSAPYKLAIAHMQAAGEWCSWLAPHVRVHRYTRVCTTRQCDDRLGIYLYIYIYARRGQPCVPRHKPRVGVGVREIFHLHLHLHLSPSFFTREPSPIDNGKAPKAGRPN